MKFKAYVSEEIEKDIYKRSIKERDLTDLPNNDVVINVKYSTLNYKDALSARGHRGISRFYPHTPGVDAVGMVYSSKTKNFKVGDEVVVTGYDLGMNTSGGFAEFISVPESWVISKRPNLTMQETMIYGTAGMTAALCVNELLKHGLTPNDGPILVTGSTGGVGSMAVGILSKIGFEVIASTGKLEQSEYLKKLGAKQIIHRREVNDTTNKPLLPKRWKGAIDNVGGNTLSTIIRSTDHRGAVCIVGLVESDSFHMNVYPFLMRGVTIIGIDSAERELEVKEMLWNKLTNDWKFDALNDIYKEVNLEDIDAEIEKILKGQQVGKILIKI